MVNRREPYARPAPYPELDGSQVCATTDPELFFPLGQGASAKGAKELCAGCPFLRPCLAFALTHAVSGIWGGTHEKQRRHLRQVHSIGRPVPIAYSTPTPSTTTTPTTGDPDDDWS